MRREHFLFVHHTTSILAKLSTWRFEHSGDTNCSLLVNPSHTDESWEGRNTGLWIIRSEFIHLALWRTLMRTEHFLFVHHATSIFGRAQHPAL